MENPIPFTWIFWPFVGYDFYDFGPFLAPYGTLLASFRSQIDPPNFISTDPHQFSTKSDHFITFSIFRPGTPPLSSSWPHAIFFSRYLFRVGVRKVSQMSCFWKILAACALTFPLTPCSTTKGKCSHGISLSTHFYIDSCGSE